MNPPSTHSIVALALGLALGPVNTRADVTLPGLFSDHMVLQREQPAPIWGTAAPGETVTVEFGGQTKTAVADSNGKWVVRLDPMPASAESRTLTIASSIQDEKSETGAAKPSQQIQDVLVGDVWVGSGQSNMAMTTGAYTKGDEALAQMVAAAPYPKLRFVRANTRWQEATAQNINGFSALLFSFGQPLQKELDVPVGLMVGAVGGTPSGFWLSEEALQNDAACQELIKKQAAAFNYDEAMKKYEKELADWKQAVADAKQLPPTPGAASPAPPVPADPAIERRAPAKVKPRPPAKPGTIIGGKVGHLYEVHIRPLMPYGMRGVLWDQGEGGTALSGVDQYTLMGALIRGWRKEWALPLQITNAAPGDGFPFIYIQKPSGGGCSWDNVNPATKNSGKLAALPVKVPADGASVEIHVKIMTYPNTGMAISSDFKTGTHPTDKSNYGRRAATVALGMVYGRKIEYYGPIYDSHKIEGDKVRVSFKHVGQGLVFRHGDRLQGFALAGEDKVFNWADAVIDGETVVVSSAGVSKPVAVRYAWANVRTWANLFNKDGLPAIPFRTDRW